MLAETALILNLSLNLIAEVNLEGYLPKLRDKKNAYPSGLEFEDESFVKYGPPSIDDPVLLIVDPIFDKSMQYIPAGYYQLTLNVERDTLFLIQTGKILATIPVFKIEIDKKKDEARLKDQMPKSFIKQKLYLRKKRKEEKKRQKKIAKKLIEPETKIYSEATIELVEGKKYFLIKYEKDSVRAWGALYYR